MKRRGFLGLMGVLAWLDGSAARPGPMPVIAAQLKPLYMTAFDLYPVDTFAAKTRLLDRAVADDFLLVLGHDDDHPLIRAVVSDAGFAYEVPRVSS